MAIFQSSIFLSLLFGCSLIVPCQSRNDAECFENCKCCLNETCHSQHGWINVCSKGCIDEHRGARCYEYCKYSKCKSCGAGSLTTTCTACKDGFYLGPDKDCSLKCPANCKDGRCESDGGVCSEGCQENFNGSFCDVCVHGKYGTECKINCPDKCLHNLCENESGHCLGCIGNFNGDTCDTCQPGFFGPDCNEKCPVNCVDNVCDIHFGICSNGCKISYSGDKCCTEGNNCVVCSSNTKCRKCKVGYFNMTCEDRCPTQCAGSCEFETGICESCKNNKYGSYCDYECSENCTDLLDVNVSQCGQLDGKCRFGCNDGYFGITCNNTCKGICIDNICIQETGKCTKGCDGEYDDFECSEISQQSESSSKIVIALGSILGFVAVAIVVAAFGFLVWKKRSSQRNLPETTIEFERPTSTLETNQDSGSINLRYDTITTDREHDYQQMAVSGSETTEAQRDDNTTDYYNVS